LLLGLEQYTRTYRWYSGAVFDSGEQIVCQLKGVPWNRGDPIAISDRGYVAFLTGTLSAEAPAVIASVFDHSGSCIRCWTSREFRNQTDVIRYVRAVQFHPESNLLVIAMKVPPGFHDSGSFVYGLAVGANTEWRVTLDRELDPRQLGFQGDDIVVHCFSPPDSTQTSVVISALGELR